MNAPLQGASAVPAQIGERIRVRGIVQGVGFRPGVWRIAQDLGVCGSVANDGEGVLIEAWGDAALLQTLLERIHTEAPPLARIESIERCEAMGLPPADFRIVASRTSTALTHVAPDAATCPACVAEIFDPFGRRFRYPFTNCTHCGPRLSIIQQIPYDRSNTTMAAFAMCHACAAEYASPADRRFHAQPVACHVCGPRLSLSRSDGRAIALDSLTFLDDADAACSLLQRGHILAIQGLGGYQLACDASSDSAVARLRAGKQRERKPFALMARDIEVIHRYAQLGEAEAALLSSPAAPIVLLQRLTGTSTPAIDAAVAPGMNTLGFMLPNTPLHHLMLRRMNRPIVMTSGNHSDEPQAITAADARARLGQIADYFLEHNRPIARRVDDSVVRVVAGQTRVLRRARGYAPAPLSLPPGFERAPNILAYGSELKNTFCLVRDGTAVLSPHIGDLEDALTRADYHQALADFRRFFEFEPQVLACDLHPDYAATRLARAQSEETGLPLHASQHHHAHIAACLADNRVALDTAPVLGVALDGIGYGEDGTLWGGEFLLADYHGFERLGTFKPVALLGGDAAAREPWRNTYAHLMAEMGWPAFAMNYAGLELFRFLDRQPRALLDGMLKQRVNAPLASSCGRLFDAVGAAVGLVRDHAHYEGQGAVELEAAVDRDCLENEDATLDYPFAIPLLPGSKLPYIEPLAMWQALFGDLILDTPVGVMAARFHRGLAKVVVKMVEKLASRISKDGAPLPQVALTGGVLQNRILFERVLHGLESKGFTVLTHRQVPCNDGGLALGQAVIAAVRQLQHS
ncbi:carbamoyltransferase HypF [Sulfuriferula plumbiphila]|uniref:Carbamoyltransferase HypF n=1 Tax=Sulfuriferula plumbiphila TaxID=171865 RepID=A0A512L8S1_9PROT|nr:carbamoyltransferase HypF [Sulfuriferula plumbiphila]BBP04282.1 carbamoyltransferase HypF [Sulfuriferula plumbiphila]GEP30888.1 carbamoyltransferase HypF [Sulfuriferula plumbiphila]